MHVARKINVNHVKARELVRSVKGKRDYPISPYAIAERIAHHERELARLRALLQLVAVISLLIGPGVVFSVDDLWQHRVVSPELASVLAEAGITSKRQLGKRLRQLCGCGLARTGADDHGALWMVEL